MSHYEGKREPPRRQTHQDAGSAAPRGEGGQPPRHQRGGGQQQVAPPGLVHRVHPDGRKLPYPQPEGQGYDNAEDFPRC